MTCDTIFAITNAPRDSGLVSTRIAVPELRSPETTPAPAITTAISTNWSRFLRNCPEASSAVGAGSWITTPGCVAAIECTNAGVSTAMTGLVRPRNTSIPGITQSRHVRRISVSSLRRKATSPVIAPHRRRAQRTPLPDSLPRSRTAEGPRRQQQSLPGFHAARSAGRRPSCAAFAPRSQWTVPTLAP